MKRLQGNLTERLIRGVILACLLMGTSLQAQTVNSSSGMSNSSDWREWKTVGEAKLTWFIFDIYTSRLKTPDGEYKLSGDISPHPFALEINYQRDISKQQLLDVTDEQWQKLGFTDSYRRQWISNLNTLFPEIKKGDELTYLTDGKVGQLIYRQAGKSVDQTLGYVRDEKLNDAFLSIWLSPNTAYPKLRKQLIGQVRP